MSIPKDFTPNSGLLTDRIVLVTGATGGLGRALAIEVARAGATVILCGRNPGKLDRLYDEIEALGGPQPAIATLDLANATAVDYDALARTIDSEFGKLDGLVHAAGLLGERTPLEQYDVPTWCRVLHVNLTAPFILTQVLLPALRKSSDASVIFVSSGVVHHSRPFWGAYAVAKTGLESVRSMLSQELEGICKVRVNSINPGRMRTAMRAAAYPGEDPSTLPTPKSVTGPFSVPIERTGSRNRRRISGRHNDEANDEARRMHLWHVGIGDFFGSFGCRSFGCRGFGRRNIGGIAFEIDRGRLRHREFSLRVRRDPAGTALALHDIRQGAPRRTGPRRQCRVDPARHRRIGAQLHGG